MTQRIQVHKQTENDLPSEVLGTAYWTEGLEYQVEVPTKEGTTKVIDIEFINDDWYLLVPTATGYETDSTGKFEKNQFRIGAWPDDHLRNPKNLVLATVSSFGDFLNQGMLSQDTETPQTQINMEGGSFSKKKQPNNPDNNGGGGLRGKASEIFDGDRSKSKVFTTEL